MNYKPGDLPDFKYESESLMPRVIGCTGVCLFVRDSFVCMWRVVAMATLFCLQYLNAVCIHKNVHGAIFILGSKYG